MDSSCNSRSPSPKYHTHDIAAFGVQCVLQLALFRVETVDKVTAEKLWNRKRKKIGAGFGQGRNFTTGLIIAPPAVQLLEEAECPLTALALLFGDRLRNITPCGSGCARPDSVDNQAQHKSVWNCYFPPHFAQRFGMSALFGWRVFLPVVFMHPQYRLQTH
jgi:hypothetical protein